MTQPTALFLADILEDAGKPADIAEKCAAELRRLHAQRDALLEALRTLLSYANTLEMRTDADGEHRAMQQARAAIKKAEDKQ